MPDTIRIRSMAPMAFTISEPNPNADKPGDAPVLRTAVLRPGMNEVDSNVYKAWAATGPSVLADGLVAEVKGDEPDMAFGFEPALMAASTEGASDGSTFKAPGPVSSSDMKSTSDTPNDDSPRSQTNSPVANPAPAAVAPAPAVKK